MKIPRKVLISSCLLLTALIACFSFLFVLALIGRPSSYIWVMDEGAYKNETYLVKMCPSG